MPQMSPLTWLFMYFYFMFLLIFISVVLYYVYSIISMKYNIEKLDFLKFYFKW
uniref:ATP synthase F0 subunit 8 n=1 Tax=Cheiloneurus chinensis TaxID=3082044 RepID=UPI002A7F5A4E|nr:ATP synthase F0 subunit 8 [Cheiloneurus chinensis]WOE90953.1 ATP synthase F0 subunit 8 [Cheiloneurus chinensis]